MDIIKTLCIVIILSITNAAHSKNSNSSINKDKKQNSSKTKAAITKHSDSGIFKKNYRKSTKTGIVTIQDKSLESLTSKGVTTLDKVIIFNNLNSEGILNIGDTRVANVNHLGAIHAKNSEIKEITVDGSIHLNNVKITSKLDCTGTINIENSVINQIITDSNYIYLNNVVLHNLEIVSNNRNKYDKPKLILNGNTAISGKIDFKNSSGMILIKSPSVSINRSANATISRKN